MQRNFKLIISIIALVVSSLCAFAQDNVEYKDVILDGKPAKLNVDTGKITLVNAADQKTTKQTVASNGYTTESATSVNASDFHIVKEGETLFQIATLYDTYLLKLQKANNLETTLVTTGQKLRVKNFDAVVRSETQANSYNNEANTHIVASGETLFSLAKRYNLSLNDLKSNNNLTSSVITVGQKLNVGRSNTVNEYSNLSVWTVVSGDTLYSIAKENGTTVDVIKNLNGLSSNTIKVGQKLRLK